MPEGTYVRWVATELQQLVAENPSTPFRCVLDTEDAPYPRRVRRLLLEGTVAPDAIVHLHVDSLPGSTASGTWAGEIPLSDRRLSQLLCAHGPCKESRLSCVYRTIYPNDILTGRMHRVTQAYKPLGSGTQVVLELGFASHPLDIDALLNHEADVAMGIYEALCVFCKSSV